MQIYESQSPISWLQATRLRLLERVVTADLSIRKRRGLNKPLNIFKAEGVFFPRLSQLFSQLRHLLYTELFSQPLFF